MTISATILWDKMSHMKHFAVDHDIESTLCNETRYTETFTPTNSIACDVLSLKSSIRDIRSRSRIKVGMKLNEIGTNNSYDACKDLNRV